MLIAFTLLDHEHQFMGRLNAMDNISQTQAHSVSLLLT